MTFSSSSVRTDGRRRINQPKKLPPSHRLRRRGRPCWVERLEERTLLAGVTFTDVANWAAVGPAPNTNGQEVNIPAEMGGGPNAVTGGIEAIAVNPGNAKNVFVGGVNGGVWETTNITANPVAWVPLTDQSSSLQISSLQFDPTDASNQTIVAGIGNISNLYVNLGPMTGLLKTTNGGATWTQLGNAPLAAGGLQGEVVSAVLPRGNTILVGVRATSASCCGFTPAVNSPQPGLFRSIDGGQSFQLISGLNNLGNGQVLDVAGDPSDANRAYVVVGGATGGIFRTDDLGAHWTNVTNLAAITTQLTSSTFTNARLAVSAAAPNPVYLAIADSGQLSGVFWSSNLGVMWTAMDLPLTPDTDSVSSGAKQGINPGGQASANLTIAADPTNPNLVYIAGDRQPDDGAGSSPFPPNSVGAINYSARIFRGNTSIAPTGQPQAVPSPQWTPLTDNGTEPIGPGADPGSAPHADSRAMVIDNGELLYSGDGGIFEETSPTTTTGTWVSVNGAPNGPNNGLQVAQFFGISYDSLSNIILGGAQDVGTPQQSASGSMVYQDQTGSDGPGTAVDDLTSTTQSARYIGGTRFYYNSANSNIGTNIPVVPSPTGLYSPPGGLNGFNNFTSVAVSTVAPPSGQSALVVINNGTNPAMPGVSGIFDSTNAGIALTTGAINYTQIPTGAGWTGVNELISTRYPAITIGGMLGGMANQNVIYAGSGNQVFLRTAATGPGATLTATAALPAGAGTIQSVATDPDNWMIAYATDGSNVYMTTDAGAHWSTITGNLSDNNVHTVTAVDGTGANAGVSAVLVGETDGVFRELSSDPDVWAKFGSNFPNSSVWGVTYSSVADGVLVAGTSGRGAFELQDANDTLFSTGLSPILVEGRQSDNVEVATFTDPSAPPDTDPAAYYGVTIFWGDGSSSAGTVMRDASGVFHVTGSHTYAEEGMDVITTEITGGGVTTSAVTATATVLDAPLTGSEGAEITGVEGNPTPPTVLLGTFTDANAFATVADYLPLPTGNGGSVVVNWGDGSAPQPLAAGNLTEIGTPAGVSWNVNASHTYAEEGIFAYTVTVTDDGGAATTITGSAIIADASLTAGPASMLMANTGVALPGTTVVGSFDDANPAAPIADFTATIDWEDGSPDSIGIITQPGGVGMPFDVTDGHTYATFGTYAITIVVKDVGGSTVTLTGAAGAETVTVTDKPVTGSTKNFTAVEGENTGLFVLATFEDPDTLASLSDVNAALAVGGWGDTTPGVPGVQLVVQQTGVDPANGDPIFEVLGSHTYAEETPLGMPDPLGVIITTLGHMTTPLNSPSGGGVNVLDAELTGSAGTEITGVEGSPTGTVLLGSFVDSNQAATVADFTAGGGTVVVSWGDSSVPETLPAGDLATIGTPDGVAWTISAAHTYTEEGTYSYTVTVTDDGGASTIVAGSAIIADAPLSAAGLVQPVVAQDEPTIFPLPVFSPPLFNGPVAVFSDGNPLPPAGSSSIADFTAEIDWGDGTPKAFGTIVSTSNSAATYEVTGSHTYADAGPTGKYNIQVFVTDDGGSALTIDNTATVTDNPITVTGILNPKSDSGLSTGTPDTTNVNQPDFFGTVLATLPNMTMTPEAYAHVMLFAMNLANGVTVQIGTVQAGSDGSWNIKSQVALTDGHYEIMANATDQFGETAVVGDVITANLLIDTTGPVIDGLFFNRLNGQVDYIIKDPVNPDGSAPSGVWVNTLLDSSNYLLTKVHANKAYPGKWIVTNVTATPDPAIPFAYDVAVTFNSGAVIQGGFYLFTIRDSSDGNSSVQDLAENHLDGEFFGSFPSGNGINGSDFVAELQGYHNKIFAPQTILGTAFAGNGGDGGPPVAPVHSGIFVAVLPRGASPIFSTSTSPSNGADPPAPKHKKGKGEIVIKTKKGQSVDSTSHAKPKALLVGKSHPKGPTSNHWDAQE